MDVVWAQIKSLRGARPDHKKEPTRRPRWGRRGTYWFGFFRQLQQSEEKKECIYKACQTLETSALAFFFSLMDGPLCLVLRIDFLSFF